LEKENYSKLMRTFILAFSFLSLFLVSTNSKAGIFDFWDPFFSGCVYDPLGRKIGCAKYSYNEQKNSGSRQRAKDICNSDLANKAKGYRLSEVLFDGCRDSGGPYPNAR
jgi:hypothetical protein